MRYKKRLYKHDKMLARSTTASDYKKRNYSLIIRYYKNWYPWEILVKIFIDFQYIFSIFLLITIELQKKFYEGSVQGTSVWIDLLINFFSCVAIEGFAEIEKILKWYWLIVKPAISCKDQML